MQFFSGFYELCFFRKESLEKFQSTRRKSSWQPNRRPLLSRNLEVVRTSNLAPFRTSSTVVRPGIRSNSKSDMLKNDSFFVKIISQVNLDRICLPFRLCHLTPQLGRWKCQNLLKTHGRRRGQLPHLLCLFLQIQLKKTPCINLFCFVGKRPPKKQNQRRRRQRSSTTATMRKTR